MQKLTEIVRQNDELFIDLRNNVRVSSTDDDVENLLRARFIRESNEIHPKDAFHMHAGMNQL